MTFDIWTFSFQIANFMVLLFILKRLLYRPVREIMERRRALAAQAMADAEAARREAEELRERQRAELEELRAARVRLREEMHAEVERERRGMLQSAGEEAQRLLDRERALFEAEKERYALQLKEQAIDTVGLYAANLCRELADEELHQALVRRLLDDSERIEAQLRAYSGPEAKQVRALTAYPLTREQERMLHDLSAAGAGRELPLETVLHRELVAGVKLVIGELIFDASLSGQLAAVTRRIRESA